MSCYEFAMSGSFSEIVIPKFRELHHHLRSQAVAAGDKAGDFQYERLPYFLNAAFVALMTLTDGAREVALRLASPDGKSRRFVTGNALALLYINVESYLSACVKAQNAFEPYFRATQPGMRSLPSSFNKLVAGLRNGKYEFDAWLNDAILDYWEKHGERVRDYRDLAEHHCIIISNVRVVRQADSDNVGLSMLLAANPEVKQPHKLDFADKGIDALRYGVRELNALTLFASRLIGFLVEKHGGFQNHTVSPDGVFEFRPPLQFGPNAKQPNPLEIPDKDTLLPAIRAEVEKARGCSK